MRASTCKENNEDCQRCERRVPALSEIMAKEGEKRRLSGYGKSAWVVVCACVQLPDKGSLRDASIVVE